MTRKIVSINVETRIESHEVLSLLAMQLTSPKRLKVADSLATFQMMSWTLFSILPQDAGLIEVAQVCKRFKDLVLLLLYPTNRLEAKLMKDWHYSVLKPDGLPPGLEPDRLSLSLKKYPYLRNCVRKLSLKIHSVSWYENISGYQRLIKLLPSLQDVSVHPPPKEYQ